MKRFALVGVGAVLGAMVVAGAVHASSNGYDPGPYSGCVTAKSGGVRMVGSLSACKSNEYGIQWEQTKSAYPVASYSLQQDGEQNATTDEWFKQLGCPEGTRALGGGGAVINGDQNLFALTSTIPSNMEDDSGNSSGWEVHFTSIDGQPHTADFQIYVICGAVDQS